MEAMFPDVDPLDIDALDIEDLFGDAGLMEEPLEAGADVGPADDPLFVEATDELPQIP